jgi:hypothetical protein
MILEMFVMKSYTDYCSADLAVTVFALPEEGWREGTIMITPYEVCRELARRTKPSGENSIFADVGLAWRGMERASHLIELIGLDPRTALASDMDEINPVFVCLSELCTGRDQPKIAFNWRAAVSAQIFQLLYHNRLIICLLRYNKVVHGIRCQEAQISRNSYKSPEKQEYGISLPLFKKPRELDIWACNHCFAHIEEQETYETIKTHVKQK